MTTDQIIQVIGLLIQCVTAGAAIWGLVYAGNQAKLAGEQLKLAGSQLKDVAESTLSSAESSRMANLMAVIQLEANLEAARLRMVEAIDRKAKLALTASAGNPPNTQEVAYAEAMGSQALEQYLNMGDRLCACIVRGLVKEEVYRRDYRNWVNETVNEHSEFFGAGTRFPHILRCHTAWKDEKSAKDPEVMALLFKQA